MMMGKAQRIWRKSSAPRACIRLLRQRCEISLLFVMSPWRMLWIRWRDSADFAPPLLLLLSLFHHHQGLCSFIIIFYKTVRSQMEREREVLTAQLERKQWQTLLEVSSSVTLSSFVSVQSSGNFDIIASAVMCPLRADKRTNFDFCSKYTIDETLDLCRMEKQVQLSSGILNVHTYSWCAGIKRGANDEWIWI